MTKPLQKTNKPRHYGNSMKEFEGTNTIHPQSDKGKQGDLVVYKEGGGIRTH